MHVVIQIQALRRKSKKLKSLLSRKKQRSKKIKTPQMHVRSIPIRDT